MRILTPGLLRLFAANFLGCGQVNLPDPRPGQEKKEVGTAAIDIQNIEDGDRVDALDVVVTATDADGRACDIATVGEITKKGVGTNKVAGYVAEWCLTNRAPCRFPVTITATVIVTYSVPQGRNQPVRHKGTVTATDKKVLQSLKK